jgi:hypothetical protein
MATGLRTPTRQTGSQAAEVARNWRSRSGVLESTASVWIVVGRGRTAVRCCRWGVQGVGRRPRWERAPGRGRTIGRAAVAGPPWTGLRWWLTVSSLSAKVVKHPGRNGRFGDAVLRGCTQWTPNTALSKSGHWSGQFVCGCEPRGLHTGGARGCQRPRSLWTIRPRCSAALLSDDARVLE